MLYCYTRKNALSMRKRRCIPAVRTTGISRDATVRIRHNLLFLVDDHTRSSLPAPSLLLLLLLFPFFHSSVVLFSNGSLSKRRELRTVDFRYRARVSLVPTISHDGYRGHIVQRQRRQCPLATGLSSRRVVLHRTCLSSFSFPSFSPRIAGNES